jgi:hypothetical protein
MPHHTRAGDRLARYPAVYRVKAGSIPVPRAKVIVVERDRTSALTLTQVIVGSIPTYDATGQSTTGRVPSLSKR